MARDQNKDAFKPLTCDQVLDDTAFCDLVALVPEVSLSLGKVEAACVALLLIVGHRAVSVGFVLLFHREGDADSFLHYFSSLLKMLFDKENRRYRRCAQTGTTCKIGYLGFFVKVTPMHL